MAADAINSLSHNQAIIALVSTGAFWYPWAFVLWHLEE